MSSTHTFCCEVCGHEHPDTYNYGDVTCEKCGREHVYDEGIHLKLGPEDVLILRASDGTPTWIGVVDGDVTNPANWKDGIVGDVRFCRFASDDPTPPQSPSCPADSSSLES